MTNHPTRRWRTGGTLLSVCLSLVPLAHADTAGVMEELTVRGQSLSVTGERDAAFRIPGGVSVIDMEELEQRNVTSIADMMRFVPGVWASSASGSDNIFFSSRGSNLDATDYDQNGIKMLQDGLPVTAADGSNHNRVIDPLAAQWATVARGANGMSFGASTLGGAVNFVTPTGREQQGLALHLNGGSHGLASLRATAAGRKDSLDGLISVESKTWDGYRDHSGQQRTGVYANTGWKISGTVDSRFYATWLDNDQDLASGLSAAQMRDDPDQANKSAVGGDFKLNVQTSRLANLTSWQFGTDRRLEFGLSVERQHLYHPIVDQVFVDFDGPGPGTPVEVFSLLIDTRHHDVSSMFRFEQSIGDHALTMGANWGSSHVSGGHYRNLHGNRNGQTNRIDNDAESLEVFISDYWTWSDDLTLVLAIQGVKAERKTRNLHIASNSSVAPSGDYNEVNPRIGLVYSLNSSVTLYANASRLYEPPTNFELEDDARSTGEPLDAMQGSVLEFGTRGSTTIGTRTRWSWDTSIYYARINDEILSVEDPFSPGTSLSANVDRTIHAGLEAVFDAEITMASGVLAPTLAFTYNHFKFDGDSVYGNSDLPAAPQYVLRGELIYQHSSGFYAGPTFDAVGHRWADFGNSYRIDSYQLLGLRAGYNQGNIRAFIEVQNLLEEDYVATPSVRNLAAADAAILNPGLPLSIFAGLTLSF